MKKLAACLLFLSVISLLNAVSQQVRKNDPSGAWKFEAPYAPEGFNTGTITVGQKEKLYTASISFSGSDYNIQGEKVKFEKDTLKFDIYIEGEVVSIIMKMTDNSSMNGKALYSAGEIPIASSRGSVKK